MWKLWTCVLLISIQWAQVQSNGMGWGSGDSNQLAPNSGPGNSIPSSPQQQGQGKSPGGNAPAENYWWLSSNPFQKPANHPGVQKGVDLIPTSNSPGPSSNYGNQVRPAPNSGSGAYGGSPSSPSAGSVAYGGSPSSPTAGSGAYGGSQPAPGSGSGAYGGSPSSPSAGSGAYGGSQPAPSSGSGAYGGSQPAPSQSNPSYGSLKKPQSQQIPQSPGSYNTVQQPQVQQPAPIPQPSNSNSGPYNNVPSAPGAGAGTGPGAGWSGPPSPQSPSGGSPPPQSGLPPTIIFDECQLTNKADCHPGGAPVPAPSNSGQVGPGPIGYPGVSPEVPSYIQPIPVVSAPAPASVPVPSQQNGTPLGGGSYGGAPQETSQAQPAPQNPGYGQINQNPSAPQSPKTPAIESTYQPSANPGSYTDSGPNAYGSSGPQPSVSFQPESPSYNSIPNQSSYQSASAPAPSSQSPQQPQLSVPKPGNPAPANPQGPSYGAQGPTPGVNPYNPSPNQVQSQPPRNYQPKPQPPAYNGNPQSTGQNYQPKPAPSAPAPGPVPAYNGNPNPSNNNDEEQPPYPGCAAALLCVQDNLCDAKGVVSEQPVTLSAADKAYRVALVACSAPGTGAVGVCCRDPNYKDPWPDMNGNGNGGGDGQHHHHPEGNKGNSNQQSGFYTPSGQQTNQPQAPPPQQQQQPGASSYNPQQQQQQQQPSNSYSARLSPSLRNTSTNLQSQSKTCQANEECVELNVCHGGFIISSEADQEALSMDINIRFNEQKCYEDYNGISFVCCKQRPSNPILFSPYKPMHTIIPIISDSEDLDTRGPITFLQGTDTNFDSAPPQLPTSQNDTSETDTTYNRGLVQSLTQLNYVTLNSNGEQVVSDNDNGESRPSTTTTPSPLPPRKVEKFRIQLSSNFGGPSKIVMTRNPFSRTFSSIITGSGSGSGGNLVSSFRVTVPQNVKITDVTDEVITQVRKPLTPVIPVSPPESQTLAENPLKSDITSDGTTTVTTSSELESTFPEIPVEASTRTAVDEILFFGPFPNPTKNTGLPRPSTTPLTSTSTSTITITETTTIPTEEVTERTTTRSPTIPTDKSKSHLYPFLRGVMREIKYVTSESGEKVKVPSQFYDPPPLTQVDLLKLIAPPPRPTVDTQAADEDESASEARQIQFLSPLSSGHNGAIIVDVCPENEKCLTEAYCANSNANEGDTDAFDIRLQVRKRSTRLKCRQPNLPVDGYCCFLREDFAALNVTAANVGKDSSSGIIRKRPDTTCGIRRPHDEDTNNQPIDGATTFGEFPWQALIFAKGQPHCGGAILNSQIVATTASCLNSTREDELLIRVGEWEIGNVMEAKPHQDLQPKTIIIHPGFKLLNGHFINDIALIVTETNIKFDYHISRICLPQPFDRIEGRSCTVTGWSTEIPGTNLQLKQSSVPIISNPTCDLKFKTSATADETFRVHRTSVCAGRENNMDFCAVNPGAPLVCENVETASYTLAGLASWAGNSCQGKGKPAVYTLVPTQIDWIYTILRRHANDINQ